MLDPLRAGAGPLSDHQGKADDESRILRLGHPGIGAQTGKDQHRQEHEGDPVAVDGEAGDPHGRVPTGSTTPHGHAVGKAADAGGHDPLAGLQAPENAQPFLRELTDGHFPPADDSLLPRFPLEDEDETARGILPDGHRRHIDPTGGGVGKLEIHLRRHPGANLRAALEQLRRHLEGGRRRGGDAHFRDLRRETPSRQGIEAHLHRLPLLYLGDENFRYRGNHFRKGSGGQQENLLPRGDAFVDLDGELRDGSIRGRPKHRVAQLPPGLLKSLSRRVHLSLGGFRGRPGSVQVTLGDVVVLVERPSPVVVRLGAPQGSPGLGQTRLGLLHLELEVRRVQPRQNLALANPVADSDGQAFQGSGDPKAKAGLHTGPGDTGVDGGIAVRRGRHRLEADRADLRGRFRLLRAAPPKNREAHPRRPTKDPSSRDRHRSSDSSRSDLGSGGGDQGSTPASP